MSALEQKRWLTLGLALLSLAFLLSTGSYFYPISAAAVSTRYSGPYEVILAPANIQQSTRKQNFEQIYDSNEWGSDESISGKGSTMKYTERAR